MNEQITKTKETKEGIKTTEFWVALITASTTWLTAFVGAVPPETAAKITAGIAALYAIARGLAKQG